MESGTKVKAEHFILAALFIGAAVYYWNARTGVFVQPQQPQAAEKAHSGEPDGHDR